MPSNLRGTGPLQGTTGAIHVDQSPEINITSFVARQKATRFVITEISTQLLGEMPELRAGDRPYWSVPVVLTSPARGIIGKVGEIAVDAMTGELLVNEETVRRMTEDARRLAERSPL
jgi:hypothetical protein